MEPTLLCLLVKPGPRLVNDRHTTKEIAHVNGRSQEHTPGAPPVQPVKTLVADATEESDYVVFPREQKNQRELSKGHHSAPKPDTLSVERIFEIQPIEAEYNEDDRVCQDQAHAAERG